MKISKGAMTIAEGLYSHKTDVDVIFGDDKKVRNYVLRTSLNNLSRWKSLHTKIMTSTFEKVIKTGIKQAAIIDNEVWVFEIDSTKSEDIVAAVKIAMNYYKVKPQEIISNVYVKNLNAESEGQYNNHALVQENKKLYSGVCEALVGAAKELGIKGDIEVRVFSHSLNPKISRDNLHDALKDGGADEVVTDDKKHRVSIGSNDGNNSIRQNTNMHLATFKIK